MFFRHASESLYIYLVVMCCLELKSSLVDPNILISMLRVKASRYDLPRIALGIHEGSPNFGQAGCPRQQNLCFGETQTHLTLIAHFTIQNYFPRTCGNSSATRTCPSTKIPKLKVEFDMSKSPNKYGVFW